MEPLFLGTLDGVPQFVVATESARDSDRFASMFRESNGSSLSILPLRQAFKILDDDGDELNILAYAHGLINWISRHRFCSNCGSPVHLVDGGNSSACNSCSSVWFPRTDPAVIMLITDGADRCVLGRAGSWEKGRYSTLAGFVETGESLEDAVRREVKEEVGMDVDEVVYEASQPWPFPRSLMVGFTCRAVSGSNPKADANELEDAQWFSREQLKSGAVTLPPKTAISHHLIDSWLRKND